MVCELGIRSAQLTDIIFEPRIADMSLLNTTLRETDRNYEFGTLRVAGRYFGQSAIAAVRPTTPPT
jgi:hypothetical protein